MHWQAHRPHPSVFGAADFAAIAADVDYVSLMTYDYSSKGCVRSRAHALDGLASGASKVPNSVPPRGPSIADLDPTARSAG